MKTWFRIYLIVASVGGGLLGAVLVTLQSRSGTGFRTAIIVAALEMYAFVTVSGCIFALDWRKGHLLLISLALQVPYISSATITYKFGSGFHFFILIGDGYIGFDTQFGSNFTFGHTDDAPWRIGINVVALAAFIILFRMLDAHESNEKSNPERMKTAMEGRDTLDRFGQPDSSLEETIPSQDDTRCNSDPM